MSKIIKVIRLIVLIPLSLSLFLIGWIGEDVQFTNIGIVLLWLNNLLFGCERYKDRVFYIAFIITFFAFILGRVVAQFFYDFVNYHIFSLDIQLHTNLCVYIALLSLYFGYIASERFVFKLKSRQISFKKEDDAQRYDSPLYNAVRYVAKTIIILTFPFNALIALEKAVFVTLSGYAEYYVSYTSRFPYIIVKLADVFTVSFFIFLSTMPRKKETRLPIFLYALSAIIGLFGGKRSQLIVPLITIVLYFTVRNRIDRGEGKWLTRKMALVCLVATPLLLSFMYIVGNLRFGNSTGGFSFLESIGGFFNNLGFSVNVISYEKLYEMRIPNKLYAIGDTIDYLKENIVTQLFFHFPIYKNQTIEKALNNNNFTLMITYLYSPKYYLSGRGLGSCYIAEAYHDLGYLGIMLWSVIYCVTIRYIYSFNNKGIIYNTMAFMALKYILEAPRTMASAFVTEFININTWLVIAVVFLISRLLITYGMFNGKRKKAHYYKMEW